ncbi:MAG: TonB family protein [Pyrinomonadaceae bacterium]|nr:TonB family protein [Sphingobacteriaceae bacterium]
MNDGTEAILNSDADFIRTVERQSSTEKFYAILDTYPNGVLKKSALSSKPYPSIEYEGKVSSYDKNGVLMLEKKYLQGKPEGQAIYYHANGQIKQIVEYGIEKGMIEFVKAATTVKYRLESFRDSTGKDLLKEGSGYVKDRDFEKELYEEGNYVNGLKDGDWKGHFLKVNHSYKEVFKEGEFISGKATLSDGTITKYKTEESPPEYPGGINAFLTYVGNNYKYTPEAQQAGVKGRVVLSFVIETSGKLSNIKVLRDIGYGTGDAAVKVLERSPKWISAHNHGMPVRVRYTLPLQLNIENTTPQSRF